MTRRARTLLLLLPLLLFLGLAYLVPFFGVIRWSVTLPEPGLGQYRAALSDPLVQSVFLRTVRICLAVTVASVLAGYVIALLWVRGGPVQKLLVELCILIPFWISVLTRAFGWLALLSNRGIINQAFGAVGLEPMRLIYVEGAVIVGLTHVFFGYMVVSLMTSIRRIDENLYAAAANLGASRLRQHLEITLPLSLPGVLAGCVLVFILAASAYATPSLLGGLRISMLAVEVFNQAITYFNWPEAAVISTALFVLIAIVVWLATRVAEGGRRKVIFQ